MTDIAFTKVPKVLERVDCGRTVDMGVIIFQTAEVNSNITMDTEEGWEDAGIFTEDSFTDESDMEYFDAEVGSPNIIAGIVKSSQKKEFAVTLMSPTDIAIGLAENVLTTYTLSANPTLVVAAPAPAQEEDGTTSFSVTLAEGANFPVGTKITVVVSTTPYGTWIESTKVVSQVVDALIVSPPLSQLPVTGAAVEQYASKEWTESTDDFNEVVKQYRFIQYFRPSTGADNQMEVIASGSAQFRKGNVTNNKAEARTATLNIVNKATRDTTNDRYNFKTRKVWNDT